MSERFVFSILADIRALTVELESTSLGDDLRQATHLDENKKYLALVHEILKEVKAEGHPGYIMRQYIEKLWGYDLDDGLESYQRCCDPED